MFMKDYDLPLDQQGSGRHPVTGKTELCAFAWSQDRIRFDCLLSVNDSHVTKSPCDTKHRLTSPRSSEGCFCRICRQCVFQH